MLGVPERKQKSKVNTVEFKALGSMCHGLPMPNSTVGESECKR